MVLGAVTVVNRRLHSLTPGGVVGGQEGGRPRAGFLGRFSLQGISNPAQNVVEANRSRARANSHPELSPRTVPEKIRAASGSRQPDDPRSSSVAPSYKQEFRETKAAANKKMAAPTRSGDGRPHPGWSGFVRPIFTRTCTHRLAACRIARTAPTF